MKVLFKTGIQTFCWMAAVTSSVASAATYDEMQRLDAAYPPGSVVVCRSDLPGEGSVHSPTTMTVRGTVISQTEGLTTYDISATWGPEGSSGMTLTYRMSQRSDRTVQYSRIFPISIFVLLLAAGPEGEKTVLEGFRSRLATGESFTPYSQTEITDFPNYITRNPGEPPVYCRQKNPSHG